MGAILADIHMIDFSDLNITKNKSKNTKQTDWNVYLQQGQTNRADWVHLVHETHGPALRLEC